jgi:DNA-binding transcriptional ArsR family regulator/uncharacterized protein YndB with AHSA1/START domain
MRDIDKIISALSSPVRREILGLIWDRELPAGEIAAAFAVTKPTISQHLSVLRDAGLVTMTAAGTSRRYRARRSALAGLRGALEGAIKWVPKREAAASGPVDAHTSPVVVVSVDVPTDQSATFHALTDPEAYSQWLGAPVTLVDGRFAATMEWGIEVRGTYELVVPPKLIVMRWDFEDDNVPVPGGEHVGYLHVVPQPPTGARVEVHQLVDTPQQAEFMTVAWTLVLGRLQRGMASRATAKPMKRQVGRRDTA